MNIRSSNIAFRDRPAAFRRRALSGLAFASLLTLAAGCTGGSGPNAAGREGAATGRGDSSRSSCAIPENNAAMVDRILALVNMERTAEGLNPITLNPLLSAVADDYACKMIDDDFFAHIDPANGDDPGVRITAAGYVALAIGENLAAGQTTPEEVLKAWMDSPPHRDNILTPNWEEVGIGVRAGGEYRIYWVLEFGDPP